MYFLLTFTFTARYTPHLKWSTKSILWCHIHLDKSIVTNLCSFVCSAPQAIFQVSQFSDLHGGLKYRWQNNQISQLYIQPTGLMLFLLYRHHDVLMVSVISPKDTGSEKTKSMLETAGNKQMVCLWGSSVAPRLYSKQLQESFTTAFQMEGKSSWKKHLSSLF